MHLQHWNVITRFVIITTLFFTTVIFAQGEVDLSGESEADSLGHVLARPWHQNVELWGFGSGAFLQTGKDGTRPNGGFIIKEATVFLEAEAWENTSLFIEIQTNRLGDDKSKFIRTGEIYGHFRNVLKKWGENLLNVKIGRIDIPFGEEYLWQDAADNPLITQTASFVYGFDEGIMLSGEIAGLNWIAAMTDGTDERSADDHPSRAVNGKISANLFPALYLSGSAMYNGKSGESAVEFGGSHFQPIGAEYSSSIGNSGSSLVNSVLYEIDGKYTLETTRELGHLSFAYGMAALDDEDDQFDRDISWYFVEALIRPTPQFYGIARYSETGTYDAEKGHHFDGKPTAGGNSAFGYDAKHFSRLSFGLGWQPNPRTLFKLEIGKDQFELIDASLFNADDEERNLIGLEMNLIF